MKQKPFMVSFAQKQEPADPSNASYGHDSQMAIMPVEAMSRTNMEATYSTSSNGHRHADDSRTD